MVFQFLLDQIVFLHFRVYSSDLDPHSGHPDPSAAKRVDLNSGILTPLLFFATIGEGYFNELLV